MDKTALMRGASPPFRTVQNAATYSVYSCDGFVTSFNNTSDDAIYQFSFWTQDFSPDAEDCTKPINDVDRYSVSLKKTFCTAVKINPNTALQLAVNILENIEKLPDNIKSYYGIPSKMKG
jgi:hypothetical protein